MSAHSRNFSLSLAILVLLAGGGWAYWRSACCTPPLDTREIQAAGILAEFHATCLREARKANGGGELVMDPATEEKLIGYCDCVAEASPARVSSAELAKLGRGEQAEATIETIGAIVEQCQTTHLQ